jgi:excisionase family DNA binding protein
VKEHDGEGSCHRAGPKGSRAAHANIRKRQAVAVEAVAVPTGYARERPTMNRLLTTIEVAEILGVPVRTLYSWRYKDEGPRARKVGRHLRYSEADVLAWLDSLAA